MRKVAIVFVLAVVMPSLVLAWLAWQSIRNQKIIFERQQTLLYQGACQSVVKDILDFMSARQSEFGRQVETLLAEEDAREVAAHFDERILKLWPFAEVGFAVSLDGNVLSPSLLSRAEARRFRIENDLFLSNQESVEVYWNSPKGAISLSELDLKEQATRGELNPGSAGKTEKLRKITPLKTTDPMAPALSRVATSEGDFRNLIGDSTEGVLGRFLQNRLKLLFWYRSPRNPNLVFGAQTRLPQLVETLAPLIRTPSGLQEEIVLALLDDSGQPVALSHADFQAHWKEPFVSAEIGEMLPHWEIAVYLLNPARFAEGANHLTATFGALIGLLLLAIAMGGWLIVADLKRQLTLARQKTDFVSNVSHELKTPLTSIRMFSELLSEGRVTDPEKQRSYLQIITSETARLTRLINNVLDFSRLERGEKKYQFEPLNLPSLVRDTVESYRPHLENHGFALELRLSNGPFEVRGDRDALSQVVVNLLSNAEKYSLDFKEIVVELERSPQDETKVQLRVLDRGLGVPHGCEEKIFEQFFRAHDSLSSGIQGSGLGLTLARQIARAHGGDVTYARRETRGSCFTLELPLTHSTGAAVSQPPMRHPS
jgi:signal transduction histidine kinase